MVKTVVTEGKKPKRINWQKGEAQDRLATALAAFDLLRPPIFKHGGQQKLLKHIKQKFKIPLSVLRRYMRLSKSEKPVGKTARGFQQALNDTQEARLVQWVYIFLFFLLSN